MTSKGLRGATLWGPKWRGGASTARGLAGLPRRRVVEPRRGSARFLRVLSDSDREVEPESFADLDGFEGVDLEGEFPFELDAYQREAGEAIRRGESVLVTAPTGAGKTVVAEIALKLALGSGGKRAIYTTPIKALSNQKFHELEELFGQGNVGLITGDVKIRPHAPCIVMTTEILRNILYQEINREGRGRNNRSNDRLDFGAVDCVILDEVHYLGDEERGTVWEETIIYLPSHVNLVCLSATLSNAEEIRDWVVETRKEPMSLIKWNMRPVPLTFYWTLFDLDRERTELEKFYRLDRRGGSKSMSKRMSSLVHVKESSPDLRDVLSILSGRKMLPAIYFIFKRTQCDISAIRARKVLKKSKHFRLAPEDREYLRRAIADLKRDHPESVRHDLVDPFLSGISSHHAGLMPAWKLLVEKAFQRGHLKLVFATHSLALGINMPAKTVVMSDVEMRKGGPGFYTREVLTHNSIMQLSGRAGRRGFDTEGSCVMLNSTTCSLSTLTHSMDQGPGPVESSFKAKYGMVLNLIDSMGLESSKDLMKRSFKSYQVNQMNRLDSESYERVVREFDARVKCLCACNALDAATSVLLPLGEVASQIKAENELWMAMCVTSQHIYTLGPKELAGVMAALITRESLRLHKTTECALSASERVYACLESLEPEWERLVEFQAREGIDETPFVDRRLAGMAEHWAGGASWREVRESCPNLDEGDIVKILHRTQDMLRQMASLSLIPDDLKRTAATAAELFHRAPLTDLV